MFQTEEQNFICLFLKATAVFLLCFWLWQHRNWYAFSLRTPGYWGLPFIGHFYKIQNTENMLPAVRKAFEDINQDTICVWLGLRPVVLTKDPVFINKLLSSHHIRDKPEEWHKAGEKMVGGGILNSNGSNWQRKRKLLAPFFQKQNIVKFFPIFNEATNTLIKKFSNLDNDMEHEVLDIIKEVFFGSSLSTILNQHPSQHIMDIKNYSKSTDCCKEDCSWNTVLNYLKLSAFFKYNKKALNFVKRFVYERVKPALESKSGAKERNELQTVPGNFLNFSLKLYEAKKLSKNELIAETHTLFEVSADTSQFTVYSTLVLLAMHPEIQKRLFTELKSVFPEKPDAINEEHLKQLPYLNMVINESMRLIPPVALLPRLILKDTKLYNNWKLPKGLNVFVSLFDLHHRKDIWGPDANEFNPENFLPKNLAKIPSGAYLPFSKGPRNCIGSQYGLYALKVAIVGLVRNFEFRTNFKRKNQRFTVSVATAYVEEPKLQILNRDD